MGRRSISTGLRFSVLERDGHTCQYCGRKPPEVELHIDHVTPVILGGSNRIDNLLTACRDCNLGKGARDPGLAMPSRPLTYEEAQAAAQQEARWWAEVCWRGDATLDALIWEIAAKANQDGVIITLSVRQPKERADKEALIRGLIAVGLLRSRGKGGDEWWVSIEEFYQAPDFPEAGSHLAKGLGPIASAPSVAEVYG